MTEKLSSICELKYELVIAGDINIDRHMPNDPMRRPDLRALIPIWEDFTMTNNLAQLNHKPTRHQSGCNSSLLDLFLTNVPERATNIENFNNITSEHEGVSMILHTKSQIKKPKSRVIRRYENATFETMQPLIDENIKLQSLFSDHDPEIIANKLIDGLKDITDIVVSKQRIQVKNRGVLYWNKDLENEKKEVEKLNKIAIESKDVEDHRAYKHKKNHHIKNIEKLQKLKIKTKISNAKTRWKCLNELTPKEDSTPAEINHKGKLISSAKEIAEEYSNFFDDKIRNMRESIKYDNFKAINVFRRTINGVDEEAVMKPATIKEVNNIIKKLKNSNARGDSELTNKII